MENQKKLNEVLRRESENGNTEAVKALLDKGADVHAWEGDALCMASGNGHTETVKLLLDEGANVHAQDDLALRWASIYGHIETVKLLLEAGADVHAEKDYALRMATGAVVRRLGYLLEIYAIASESELSRLRDALTETYAPLDPMLPEEGTHLRRWRLQLNITPQELESVRAS